jgi:hypothetical protein
MQRRVRSHLEASNAWGEQQFEVSLDIEIVDVACGTAPLFGERRAVGERRELPWLAKSRDRSTKRISKETAARLENTRGGFADV